MRIVIMTKTSKILLILIIIIALATLAIFVPPMLPSKAQGFDGERAFEDVKYQVDLGPRTLGSTAHDQVVTWLVDQLTSLAWQVEVQETQISNQAIRNVVARRGEGTPWVIFGSHYDSRPVADRDPNPANRTKPVPGADDGASSTATLLELARVIPKNIDKQVWLVFFDAEDAFGTSGPSLATGSEYFVSQLQGKPNSVVVLDMVGDKNLDIYMEGNSNRSLNNEIWAVAQQLGYPQFIPQYKYDILDDHIPFIDAGIRAVDIIDFNYPYWHTTADTLDKVSAQSLQVVGYTMLKWLEQTDDSSNSGQ